ncbi:hypothetical protein BB561_006362 [Smittium simulii]|uniref:non-specific serine/threonine protein kinase n=1 Tax=Smittium simulii TaxID=133385 RepID=A0A2T9Y4Z1_9FUNG|nr:hypothetical protein BB561_006362 [Smittium simulii]
MDSKATPILSVGDYIIGSEIGRGSFAKVFKGFNKKTNKNVAIKSVSRINLTKKLLDNLEIEINILKASRHQNVVELIECLKSKNHIHLVMEYCSLGDLSIYIKARKKLPIMQNPFGGLSYNIIQSFVSQIGSALEYLRQKNVIHRDIKPQNLLLFPPEGYIQAESELNNFFPVLKIADFGFARSLMQSSLADTLCGSPLYMAPEILRYEKYDARADLWSVGAVVYEMCTGKPPFSASNHIELQHKIDKYNDILHFPDELEDSVLSENTKPQHYIPSEIKKLISLLLKKNAENRISFEDFFVMAAFKSFDFSINQNIDQLKLLSNLEKHNTLKNHSSDKESNNLEYKIELKNHILPKNYNSDKALDISDSTENPPQVTNLYQIKPNMTFEDQGSNKTINSSKYAQDKSKTRELFGQQNLSAGSSDAHQFSQNKKYSKYKDESNALLEKEYVVIETRAVEINSLADELETTPQTNKGLKIDNKPKGIRPQVLNQISALSEAVSNAVPVYWSKPESFEKEYPLKSRTSKDLSLEYSKNSSYPSSSFSFLEINLYDKQSNKGISPEEEATIRQMESLAYKAHSVAWLADMKVSNLRTFEENNKYKKMDNERSDDKMELFLLLMGTNVDITNGEAFALYLKALSLLHKAIICARSYWNHDGGFSQANTSPEFLVSSLNRRSSLSSAVRSSDHRPNRDVPYSSSLKTHNIDLFPQKKSKTASQAFNNVVQWIRSKFNSCLESADLLKSISDDDNVEFYNTSVEKILYQKALELSRAAALKELNWENPFECERAYQIAIWMLSAILEKTSGDPDLIPEDLLIVEDFISAAVKRLESLKQKIANTIKPT